MSDSKTTSGGIGFLGLLTIAFVVLKLCKVIDWSWWWVTCPIWGPKALVSRITRAHLKGQSMWNFHGEKLKFIKDQIQKITSDMLYNIGPKIYYFKR